MEEARQIIGEPASNSQNPTAAKKKKKKRTTLQNRTAEQPEEPSTEEALAVPSRATSPMVRLLQHLPAEERNEEIRSLTAMEDFEFDRACNIARNNELLSGLGNERPWSSESHAGAQPTSAAARPEATSSTTTTPPSTQSTGDSSTDPAVRVSPLASQPLLDHNDNLPSSTLTNPRARLEPTTPGISDAASSTGIGGLSDTIDNPDNLSDDRMNEDLPPSAISALPVEAQGTWVASFFDWLSREEVPSEAQETWQILLRDWVSLEHAFNFESPVRPFCDLPAFRHSLSQ